MDPVSAALPQNLRRIFVATLTGGASPNEIRVLLGGFDVSDANNYIVPISQIHEHPNYNFPFYDYSILKLSSPLTFSEVYNKSKIFY